MTYLFQDIHIYIYTWRTLCYINSCSCKVSARLAFWIVVSYVSREKRSIIRKALVKIECSDAQLMFMMYGIEIGTAEIAALSAFFLMGRELHFVSPESLLHATVGTAQCMRPASPCQSCRSSNKVFIRPTCLVLVDTCMPV